MGQVITIRDWDNHFEKAQTRKIEGPLSWVAIPTKHDGKSFRRLMAHDNGPAFYGVWVLLVQVAAKQKRRGVLADDDGPLTATDIHLKTGLPKNLVEEAVKVLCSKDIGWVVVAEWEHSGSVVALQDRTGQDSTEQDRTEQNRTRQSAPPAGGFPPELVELIGWWNDLRGKSLVQAGVTADPPSEAVRKGWERVQRSALLREKLADKEKLTSAIRAASLCREGWFRLEKLLGGKNRDGEYIVVKLLDGGYADQETGNDDPRNTARSLNAFLARGG